MDVYRSPDGMVEIRVEPSIAVGLVRCTVVQMQEGDPTGHTVDRVWWRASDVAALEAANPTWSKQII